MFKFNDVLKGVAVCTAFCAALPMATAAMAQDEGELVLYYGMSRTGVQPVIDAFEAETGITVRALRQPTEELMSTVELEMRANRVTADALFISEAQLKALNDTHNALRPYEPANFDQVPDDLKDAENLRIPILAALYVIQFNTSVVAPEEAPTRYADLLDERWVNQLVIADPQSSSSVHGLIWLLTEQFADAPFGWDYFERLGQMNVLLAGGHGNIRDMIVSGERSVGIQVAGTANQSVLAGEPTDWRWPEEGTSAEILSIGLMNNSPNPENAEKFVDFILSIEGQRLLAENTGHSPVRVDSDFAYADGANIGNLDIDIHAVDVDFISNERIATMRSFQNAMGR